MCLTKIKEVYYAEQKWMRTRVWKSFDSLEQMLDKLFHTSCEAETFSEEGY